MEQRIPGWLRPLAYWLGALWMRCDWFKPWKIPRILRAIRSARKARRRPREKNLIVFITPGPAPRISKVSYALRAAGWRTILLYRRNAEFDFARYFDGVERFVDVWDALEKASKYAPVAYHVFAWSIYGTAASFIRYRPGKVVFDNNDQLAGMSKPVIFCDTRRGQLALERYCLEHADGIRCRDMTTQYAKRVMGYRIRGKRIFYPDFGFGVGGHSDRLRSGPPSVAFCGVLTVAGERSGFLALFQALSSQAVHVHVYPNLLDSAAAFEDRYSEYLAWGKACPYFHFHRPVPPEDLAWQLSRYTCAIYGWGSRIHLGRDNPTSHRRAADCMMGSRISDYIEAGLILLVDDGRLVSWLARRYRLGTVLADEFFSNPRGWLARVRDEYGGDRQAIRRAWTMPRQLHRLIAFYRSL